MLVSVCIAGVTGIACYLGYKKIKTKKTNSLKEGDYVFLRHAYYDEYPRIPKNHALTVDKIEGEMATVCYMEPSEIHQVKVRKDALRKVS